jgi:hypothetical protein
MLGGGITAVDSACDGVGFGFGWFPGEQPFVSSRGTNGINHRSDFIIASGSVKAA